MLNSIVFIILLIGLSRTIYFYTDTQVYKEVNESLYNAFLERNPQGPGRELPGNIRIGRDPSLNTIIWGPNGELIEAGMGENNFFEQSEKTFFTEKLESIEDIVVEGYAFRTLSTKVNTEFGELTLQVIRNVDSQKEMLDRLLLILIIGGGVGCLFAIGGGYFLAGRALVPIQRAWDNQQQFVSDASHELRTPLSVIQSRTDLLFQHPTATVEERAVDISIISKETRRLIKLVTNLLTLARSDSNRIEVNKTRFFLNDLLAEITEQYRDIAMFQGKVIHNDTKDIIPFFGDKERIHQLIVILIDNALKFTDDDGEIHLTCTMNANSLTLSVKDNGSGIPEADIPNIFNRFYQSEKSRSGNEGSGLGLSIAKWITENHQGTIRVKSEWGKGTTMDVVFPKNKKTK